MDHRDGLFYIRTNQGAKNFRLVTAPVADPGKANWKEIIAHRPAVKIDDIDLFADHLVVSELEGGLQHIRITNLKTIKSHRLTFPEPVYTAFVSTNREYNTPVLRFGYQSMVTPNSIFDYDMDKQTRMLMKQTEVPGGFDKANYQSERIFATAVRRHEDSALDCLSARHKDGRQSAVAALWLWLLRRLDVANFFVESSESCWIAALSM